MRFFGTATKDNHAFPGALISVTIDGHDYKKVTTGKNGKFKFDFDMGHQYRLSFSATGCVDMYMLLDLRVPPEKMNLFPDYAIEVPFFEPSNKAVKVEKYKDQPFAKVIYDLDLDESVDDFDSEGESVDAIVGDIKRDFDDCSRCSREESKGGCRPSGP